MAVPARPKLTGEEEVDQAALSAWADSCREHIHAGDLPSLPADFPAENLPEGLRGGSRKSHEETQDEPEDREDSEDTEDGED